MPRFVLKIIVLLIVSLSLALQVAAQELNCKVTVFSQKITGVDNTQFQALQRNLSELMNATAWTNQKLDEKEKISCTFILTLDAKTAENTYQANVQIQANRPVFNASYTTPLLNHKDKKVNFSFLPNESLQYAAGGKNNDLVAVAAYYAYLIIGLDADSFSKFGGTSALKSAQQIVLQQGQNLEGGWSATERNINRYWIVEDLLNYKDLRQSFYTYHREGLDKMVTDPQQAMENILESIRSLENVYKKSSDVSFMHVLFDAKANEITQSIAALPNEKRQKMYKFLTKIDPGHLGIYKALE